MSDFSGPMVRIMALRFAFLCAVLEVLKFALANSTEI